MKTTTLFTRWRLLGLLPLAFFLARLVYFANDGDISQILWLCHFSNFTLALGLLFDLPILIGVSAYWLLLAMPFWIIDVWGFGLEGLTSAATHIGGTLIALLAWLKISPPRRIWLHALIWYLSLQFICRLGTPPELNINIAHAVYRGWERIFPDYWFYWLLTTSAAGLSLWLLDATTLWLAKRKDNP